MPIHARGFDIEAARRALLSQGYVVHSATQELVVECPAASSMVTARGPDASARSPAATLSETVRTWAVRSVDMPPQYP